jgi:hypothetical protein
MSGAVKASCNKKRVYLSEKARKLHGEQANIHFSPLTAALREEVGPKINCKCPFGPVGVPGGPKTRARHGSTRTDLGLGCGFAISI